MPTERQQQFCVAAYSVKGLKLPDEAEALGTLTNAARMAIFRPQGTGPFPAIVLLHTCAKVDFDPQHMRYWASRAVQEGYVAFVLDSWTQRGSDGVCRGGDPRFQRAHIPMRVRDAYEALAHLRQFDFVDAGRVAAVGFSNGGRVSYLLSSSAVAKMFASDGRRYTATVSVYGQCFNRDFRREFLLPDADRPLLALLGALDEDGDPRDCVPRLEALRQKNVPVEWHVFPDAGHAWDQPTNRVPHRVMNQVGSSGGVLFAYDARVAAESRERAFDFLGRLLKQK
jgi:dienelactone hydrolase